MKTCRSAIVQHKCLSVFRATDADLEGRSEVVLEGSYDLESGWSEYNFRFKPGNVSRRLPIVCKSVNLSVCVYVSSLYRSHFTVYYLFIDTL